MSTKHDHDIGIALIQEMIDCGTDVDIVFSDSQYKKVVDAFSNLIKSNKQMKQDLVYLYKSTRVNPELWDTDGICFTLNSKYSK